MWSVHRQTPPYLSVRHSDVVTDLGSAYYWNAPGLFLGNKVRYTHTKHCKIYCILLMLHNPKYYFFFPIEKIYIYYETFPYTKKCHCSFSNAAVLCDEGKFVHLLCLGSPVFLCIFVCIQGTAIEFRCIYLYLK